jgi:hypothetical protein
MHAHSFFSSLVVQTHCHLLKLLISQHHQPSLSCVFRLQVVTIIHQPLIMLARSTSRVVSRVAASHGTRVAAAATTTTRSLATIEPQAPSTFSPDKMENDKRYQGSIKVPESLLAEAPKDSPYSIQGKFREGRAAYLDMSATTPLDPRVLDAMAPFMVRIA